GAPGDDGSVTTGGYQHSAEHPLATMLPPTDTDGYAPPGMPGAYTAMPGALQRVAASPVDGDGWGGRMLDTSVGPVARSPSPFISNVHAPASGTTPGGIRRVAAAPASGDGWAQHAYAAVVGPVVAPSRVASAGSLSRSDMLQREATGGEQAGTTQAGTQPPPDQQQPAAPNIEQIARQVYDHLRRRLLIDQERRGRPLP
ncbi:MAG TPA: hypothetical protein PKC19_22470, partial [Roseiflexaceae bacterium]|nr:hypothetical protein [Roseiflexaceae bacterium]